MNGDPSHSRRRATPLGFAGSEHSMLMNIALWIILVAMIVIVPCGCVLTRPGSENHPPPGH